MSDEIKTNLGESTLDLESIKKFKDLCKTIIDDVKKSKGNAEKIDVTVADEVEQLISLVYKNKKQNVKGSTIEKRINILNVSNKAKDYLQSHLKVRNIKRVPC